VFPRVGISFYGAAGPFLRAGRRSTCPLHTGPLQRYPVSKTG